MKNFLKIIACTILFSNAMWGQNAEDDQNYQQSLNELRHNIDNKDAVRELQKLLTFDKYNTEEANYLLAVAHLHQENYAYISKAISFDSMNVTYRKMRLEAYAKKSSSEEILEQVINDAAYLVSAGEASSQILHKKGLSEQYLANYYYERNDVEKSLALFKQAVCSFEEAHQLNANYNVSHSVTLAEKMIQLIEE